MTTSERGWVRTTNQQGRPTWGWIPVPDGGGGNGGQSWELITEYAEGIDDTVPWDISISTGAGWNARIPASQNGNWTNDGEYLQARREGIFSLSWFVSGEFPDEPVEFNRVFWLRGRRNALDLVRQNSSSTGGTTWEASITLTSWLGLQSPWVGWADYLDFTIYAASISTGQITVNQCSVTYQGASNAPVWSG